MADLSLELHELVLALDRAAEERLRPSGLSYRRFVALHIVAENPGIAARELAKALSVSEAAVSQMLPALIESGLVASVRVEGGGRRRPLRVTDAGLAVLGEAQRQLGGSLDSLVRGLGLDPESLAHALHTIRTAL